MSQVQFLKNKIKSNIRLFFNKEVSGIYSRFKKNDIILASYPKSGNTWLRFLFANLLYEKVDFNSINKQVPDLHVASNHFINNLKTNRIFKTHEHYSKKYANTLVVYILRNPSDIVVSYYRWYVNRKDYKGDFDSFFKKFVDGKVLYGSWKQHFDSWFNCENCIFIDYNNLIRNTEEEILKVCCFLNLNIDIDKIRSAIQKSSLENMSNLESSQKKSDFFSDSKSTFPFVRKTKNNTLKLSSSQIKIINRVFCYKDILTTIQQ